MAGESRKPWSATWAKRVVRPDSRREGEGMMPEPRPGRHSRPWNWTTKAEAAKASGGFKRLPTSLKKYSKNSTEDASRHDISSTIGSGRVGAAWTRWVRMDWAGGGMMLVGSLSRNVARSWEARAPAPESEGL